MADLIPAEDLKVEVLRHSAGGQHVGVSSGLKVTHLPSGISVTIDNHRSQHRNREIALHMIEAAVTHPKFPA